MDSVDYAYTKQLDDIGFDDAVAAVTDALGEEGFGVLTNIDVRATLKKKLDVDFRNYEILGACNPELAYKGLQSEPQLGALLPCNVLVQQDEADESIQVGIIKPSAMFDMVDNDTMQSVADDADARLRRVIESL